MSDTIIQLSAGDFDEMLLFLAKCFNKPEPDWFQKSLPGIYQPTDRHTRCNYAIRRNGALAGVVGLFPATLRVGGASLRVAGIGGVSTDPQFRGQGLMSQLMTHVTQQIRTQGYDLSWLGGLRPRYRYFGWEIAGTATVFHLNIATAAWWRQERNLPAVTLQPMPEDGTLLGALQQMQRTQSYHCERQPEDFGNYLRTRRRLTKVARDPAGSFAGYIVGDEKGGATGELVARDAQTAAAIACAWVDVQQSPGTFPWHTLPDPTGRTLADLSDNASTGMSGNWQVFNWPKVIATLLAARHAAAPLLPGSVTVGISGTGQTLRLTVEGANATCQTTSAQPDISADAPTMTRLLFGPLPPSRLMPLPPSAKILDAWCPLPLWLPPQDHV